MSREIKFRAWIPWHNEMKYDELSVGFDRSAVWYDGSPLEKQPILMQYTGLKDKNGVEIYEGDVIFYNSTGYKGEVSFSTLGGCSYYVFENGVGAEFGEKKLLEMVSDLEVIGNIYENPELLERSV